MTGLHGLPTRCGVTVHYLHILALTSMSLRDLPLVGYNRWIFEDGVQQRLTFY